MKWIRIAALVLFVLLVMRCGSWLLGWLSSKLARLSARTIVLASNAVAFGLFLWFLHSERLPGEPMDLAAVLFGLVVYLLYGLSDLLWTPWKTRT